jgi:hypothetical protein
MSFRGSLVSPSIDTVLGLNQTKAVFAIVNTYRSRVEVNVLRMVAQLDSFQTVTGNTANRVMPIFRTRRVAASSISGGLKLNSKVAFDTLETSDNGVVFLSNPGIFGEPDTLISYTQGAAVWTQFMRRQASAVEQVYVEDSSLIARAAASIGFILFPGEAIVVEQVAAIPTGGTSWIEVLWEETDFDTGYIIGGNVKTEGENTIGAKVILITDSDRDLPNPELEILTTDINGNFSKEVSSNVKASVFVQHRVGESLFTDEGKPYIEE